MNANERNRMEAGMPDPWLERREIGPCVLYLGDCLDILPTLQPVDAVITDPPYCSGGMYRGDRLMRCADKYEQHGNITRRIGFQHDAKDQRAFTSWFAEWIKRSPIADGGYFLSFIDWRNLPALTDAIQWAGLIWRGICSWDKGLGSRAPHKGYARHQAEYVAWATLGACRIATHGGPFPGVYRHSVKQADKFHVAVQRPLDRCLQPDQDAPHTLPDDPTPLTDAPERPQPQPA
jgi:site-specific DNA-methyltransferase (adenine-specific)